MMSPRPIFLGTHSEVIEYCEGKKSTKVYKKKVIRLMVRKRKKDNAHFFLSM